MSFQEQQQPGMVYPTPTTTQPASSSHSNGSFGSVFIVLAVIIILSAVACFLGRLCSRRHHHHRHQSPKHSHAQPRPEKRESKQGHRHGNFPNREFGDIEFGFGKGNIPNGKSVGNNGEFGKLGGNNKPNRIHGEIRGEPRFEFKGDQRFGDEGELKGGDFNAK